MVRHTKFQIIIIAVIVLIIPTIIVFQLTKADITIENLTFPIVDGDTFKNQCFFGQTKCVYEERSAESGVIVFDDQETSWLIRGENVWCIKSNRQVAEPVADPVGVITDESEVTCNNLAIFNKSEWDLQITHADLVSGGSVDIFTFTMKGL